MLRHVCIKPLLEELTYILILVESLGLALQAIAQHLGFDLDLRLENVLALRRLGDAKEEHFKKSVVAEEVLVA